MRANPYRTSGYVTGAAFYGREQLVADITRARNQATYGDGYAIGNEFLTLWLPSAPWEALSDVSDAGTLDLYRREKLHKAIAQRFDREELRTLCFSLGVDYDSLPGEGKAAKARELVSYMERQGKLEQLLHTMGRQRLDAAIPVMVNYNAPRS